MTFRTFHTCYTNGGVECTACEHEEEFFFLRQQEAEAEAESLARENNPDPQDPSN